MPWDIRYTVCIRYALRYPLWHIASATLYGIRYDV